jgi:hypothetical protein
VVVTIIITINEFLDDVNDKNSIINDDDDDVEFVFSYERSSGAEGGPTWYL